MEAVRHNSILRFQLLIWVKKKSSHAFWSILASNCIGRAIIHATQKIVGIIEDCMLGFVVDSSDNVFVLFLG